MDGHQKTSTDDNKLTNIGEAAMFRTQMILKEPMFSTRLDIGGDV